MKTAKTQTGPLRGRPPKFAGERTRGPLTIRLRDRVRDDLAEAATSSGRSLSEEVEYRLELALSRRDYLIEQWGQDIFSIAEAAARSLWHIERFTGRRWIEDQRTFDLFTGTMSGIVANYRDMVLVKRRATPSGPFEGKSDVELVEIFASAAGISPPRPLDAASTTPEQEYNRHTASVKAWHDVIEKRGSRPLESSEPKAIRKRRK